MLFHLKRLQDHTVNGTVKIVEINKRLRYFDITMIDNNNVSKSKSLHLNSKNILQFA